MLALAAIASNDFLFRLLHQLQFLSLLPIRNFLADSGYDVDHIIED